jgi:uncharacterized OsmC-like protein
MACSLKRRQSDGVFVGTAGRKVRVDVQSEQPAELVQLIYAGEVDGAPPFEFTIKKGQQKLLIVAVGVDSDQRMKIVELSGDEVCPLRNFFWSTTHFHTTLDIEGK